MAEILGPNKEGRDGMEIIIEALLKKAAKGDVKVRKDLLTGSAFSSLHTAQGKSKYINRQPIVASP
jgi:hypothetical protein